MTTMYVTASPLNLMSDEDRQKVVEIAKSWIKTPYVPNARLKGIGVDCLQFVACVFEEAGFFNPQSEPDLLSGYDVSVHQHCEDPRYLEGLERHAIRIEEKDVKAGDVAIYFLGKGYAHAGIYENETTLIHAVMTANIGVTYVDPKRDPMLRRAKKVYMTFIKDSK